MQVKGVPGVVMAVVMGLVLPALAGAAVENNACVQCHLKVTPGQVADWQSSRHFEEGIVCSDCHGDEHSNAKDFKRVAFPDEALCGQCHEEQFNQFKKGKHNFGWTTLNALPVTALEPDELMEGGVGCGGCHNMGIKTAAQRKELHRRGYRYQNNSCDECHTRHAFSKKEAQNPRACEKCHMGYDHPQWEQWRGAKHGTRFFVKEAHQLPDKAAAPRCQDCHLPDGTHENRTAWGFLGVRLPLPKDPQWAADRVTILKALGMLNPETGKPTARLAVMKSIDMVRLSQESWQKERDRMVAVCRRCHSENYARTQLARGDRMIQKTDHLLARGIKIVAGLYQDGLIRKPDAYAFAYPDLLYFMRTGGGNLENLSRIDQVLFQMYMKHRMRTYQGVFHMNPDYAYWYGWAMMTKDLGEIEEIAAQMRARHQAGK